MLLVLRKICFRPSKTSLMHRRHLVKRKKKWPNNKQQYTKHTYQTKVRIKTCGELRCSGRISGSCYTSDTRRVNLVTNPVIGNSITCNSSPEGLLYDEEKKQNKRIAIPLCLFFFLFCFFLFLFFCFCFCFALTITLHVGAFFFQIESSAIKVSMLYNPGMTNK